MRIIPQKFPQMYVETTSLTNPSLIGNSLTIEYIFLPVSININTVLEEDTIRQRKKRLDQIIQGNSPQYPHTAALVRVKAQKGGKSGFIMEALMRLSHSKRLLNASVLIHALGADRVYKPGFSGHFCDRNTTGMLFKAWNS